MKKLWHISIRMKVVLNLFNNGKCSKKIVSMIKEHLKNLFVNSDQVEYLIIFIKFHLKINNLKSFFIYKNKINIFLYFYNYEKIILCIKKI